MDGLSWKTLLKWMIWGYHYFWKHPHTVDGSEILRLPVEFSTLSHEFFRILFHFSPHPTTSTGLQTCCFKTLRSKNDFWGTVSSLPLKKKTTTTKNHKKPNTEASGYFRMHIPRTPLPQHPSRNTTRRVS